MNKSKSATTKTIITVIIVILITGWTVNTLLGNAEEVEERVYTRDFSIDVPVKVAEVTSSSLREVKRYLGTFEANRQITIKSQTQGEVLTIHAEEGDELKTNQLIATVDSEQIEYQLIATKAAYVNAQKELQRYQNLTDKNAVAKINLEQAELQAANAESNLKILIKQLTDTKIKSPFPGTLSSRMFDLGSVLGQGEPLGVLIDISKLKLVVSVPEEEVSNFYLGKEIMVHSDVYPTKTYKGTVTMIGDQADKAHKFEVQIKLKNSDEAPLKAGMYGWIENSQSNGETGNTIPVTAVIGSSKDAKVFKVVDQHTVLQPVVLGIRSGETIEVKEGLSLGEIVVTDGQVNLSEGTAVSF